MTNTPHHPDEPLEDDGNAVFGEDVEDRPVERRSHRGGARADRRSEKRGGVGCLAAIVALVVVLGLLWFGGNKAIDAIQSKFGKPDDYSGSGTGSVTIHVQRGDTATDIGKLLQAKGVVKSVKAFVDAARADSRSTSIQVGYYQLRKQLPAKSALGVLVNPKNQKQNVVTIPEGSRVNRIVDLIASKSKITKPQLQAALKNPQKLGLPAGAKGNPEGFLFPATYSIAPGQTAVDLLREMVRKSEQVQANLNMQQGAKRLGLTPEQVLTVASILEYEANRKVDYPKVARVIYNRLDKDVLLQLDSTVSYFTKRTGDVWTTAEERKRDSSYNTYKNKGLPSGPIGNPGEATIKAALNPAQGKWMFFLPDIEKGTTEFYVNDSAKRRADLARLRKFCAQSEKC